MTLAYKIEYLERVLEEDLPRISAPDRKRIRLVIEGKLMTRPEEFGKPLRYSLKGARALRVGDYRVIFVIEEDPAGVLVVKIGHRKDVYER